MTVVALIIRWIQVSIQGSPAWLMLDALLGALFSLAVAMAAVFCGAAFGVAVSRRSNRALWVGLLLGLVALLGATVPGWFAFEAGAGVISGGFLSLLLTALLDLVALTGAFLVAIAVAGLLFKADPSHRP